MITLDCAHSWLNQFSVSRLKPETRRKVDKLMDPAASDHVYFGLKEQVLQGLSGLDPLEKPELLLSCALAEHERRQMDACRASVREAYQLYPENLVNRHRRAVVLWVWGILEYEVLENNTAYSCWQAARLLFQELANLAVKMHIPEQSRWYYERLRDMNVDMACTAEEAFTWLNIFPEIAAGKIGFRTSRLTEQAGARVTVPAGDLDANIRGLISEKQPDSPIYILVDKVIDHAQKHRFASALRLMEQIQFAVSRGEDRQEQPEAWVECGLVAHQIDMQEEAVELLRHAAAMVGSRTHRQAVVFWMIGAVLWRSHNLRKKALVYWNTAIAIFRELEVRVDRQNRQQRWEWYHRLLEILPLALDQEVKDF